MEEKEPSFEVKSIFHQVSIDINGTGPVSGFLVLANEKKDLVFWWKPYKGSSSSTQIVIKLSELQKILVNYQKVNSYLLFSLKNQQTVYQFNFQESHAYLLLQIIQLLSLHQQNQVARSGASLDDAINFISDSYDANETRFRLYDIIIHNGNIEIPPDFCPSALGSPLFVVVRSEVHIISQFGIKPQDFFLNPIQESELSSFTTLYDLKQAVLQRGMSSSLRPHIWPLLLNILPFEEERRSEVLTARTNEYLQLKEQWQTLSKTQLKFFPEIRDSFTTIKVDVKRTHPVPKLQSIPQWDTILTSILRTFVIWNMDIRYTQGLNDLAINFMVIFLPAVKRTLEERKQISENVKNIKKELKLKSGNQPSQNIDEIAESNEEEEGVFEEGYLNSDEADALSFWTFAVFAETVASGLTAENMMIMQNRELSQILEIIKKFHPAGYDWLSSNGMKDLSFMISSFILAFGRSFSQNGIARIWESLICSKAPWLFLRYISAALLILSFPSFFSIPSCNSGKLISIMDQVFFKQDIGAVIGVALSMMHNEEEKVNQEIKEHDENKKVLDVPSKPKNSKKALFQPDRQYEECYSNFSGLYV